MRLKDSVQTWLIGAVLGGLMLALGIGGLVSTWHEAFPTIPYNKPDWLGIVVTSILSLLFVMGGCDALWKNCIRQLLDEEK